MNAITDMTSRPGHDEGHELVPTPGGRLAAQIRVMAVAAAAHFHGAELAQTDLRCASDEAPSPGALAEWVRSSGLWAKAVRLSWKELVSLRLSRPVPLLLKDGGAVLLLANDRKRDLVSVRHSRLAPISWADSARPDRNAAEILDPGERNDRGAKFFPR